MAQAILSDDPSLLISILKK